MESGDIIALAAGLTIVVLVAVLANPQSLSGLHSSPVTTSPQTPLQTPIPVQIITIPTPVVTTPTPQPTIAPPYRIFYTDKPFTYPVFKLPDNMIQFGASDIPLTNEEMVTFAYIEDVRGGLTQKFSVPYPILIINATVTSEKNPQYGDFRMVLCYASDGSIISGMEVLNRGSEIRIVQAPNVDLYMIISTTYIDKYRIELMTPKRYYDQYKPR